MRWKLASYLLCLVVSWPMLCAAQPTPTPIAVVPPGMGPVPVDHGDERLDGNQPRLNEVLPRPRNGNQPWIELWIPGAFDGRSLALITAATPDAVPLPPNLPTGTHILVCLDSPVESCEPSDPIHGAAPIVHLPAILAESWSPTDGWVALVAPGSDEDVVDFVAWGGPPRGARAGERGRWAPRRFVPFYENFGVYDTNTEISRGDSIGRIADADRRGPRAWTLFHDPEGCGSTVLQNPCEVTPGAPNPVPRIRTFSLATAQTVGLGGVGLAWTDRPSAVEYQLQVDKNSDFPSPIVDVLLSGTAVRLNLQDAGNYFYRVRWSYGGSWSPWTETQIFVVYVSPCTCKLLPYVMPGRPVSVCSTTVDTLSVDVIENIRPTLQRKDSWMACRECELINPARPYGFVFIRPEAGELKIIEPPSTTVATPVLSKMIPTCRPPGAQSRWITPYRHHGSGYCLPASVSMVASAYGICLSQDRIAFYLNVHKERLGVRPVDFDVNDMSHQEAAAYSCYEGFADNDCEKALAWALALRNGEVAGASSPEEAEMFIPYPTTSGAAAAAADVETWLAEGRPIMAEIGGHVVVGAGFCRDGIGLGHLLIYDPKSGPYVTPFDLWHTSIVKQAWVAPGSLGEGGGRIVAGRGHSDDLEMWLDSDGDSLCDFDEIRRFSTDPNQLVTYPGLVDAVRVYFGDFNSDWSSYQWSQ